jgi:hypothetical protein
MYFNAIKQEGRPICVDYSGRPDTAGRQGFEIVVNDLYSYPGLLTLGINTDLLGIAHRQMFPALPSAHHGFNRSVEICSMQLGVASAVGLIFLLGFAIASVLVKRLRKQTDPLAVAILAIPTLGMFSVVALLLPFVGAAIYEGYWLPRLVLPGIVGFALLALFGYSKLDEALSSRRTLRLFVRTVWFVMTVTQTVVHALILCT